MSERVSIATAQSKASSFSAISSAPSSETVDSRSERYAETQSSVRFDANTASLAAFKAPSAAAEPSVARSRSCEKRTDGPRKKEYVLIGKDSATRASNASRDFVAIVVRVPKAGQRQERLHLLEELRRVTSWPQLARPHPIG